MLNSTTLVTRIIGGQLHWNSSGEPIRRYRESHSGLDRGAAPLRQDFRSALVAVYLSPPHRLDGSEYKPPSSIAPLLVLGYTRIRPSSTTQLT